MQKNRHFTLIELLVVVAIIGILASILLPSLSKARYKAQLAVCLSNLNQNHKAIYIYTLDNDGYYPLIAGGGDRWQVKGNHTDRRDFLNSVFGSIDQSLSCPLSPNNSSREESNAERIYANYDFYAGTYLDKNDESSSMHNVSQETTYMGDNFSAVMGDQLRTSDNWLISSHPAEGLRASTSDSSSYHKSSYSGKSYFKNMDRNFVFKDGSSKTYKGINSTGPILTDQRFKRISWLPHNSSFSNSSWIPID